MATSKEHQVEWLPPAGQQQIKRFRVKGLLGRRGTVDIRFPITKDSVGFPSILILSGRNGSGKTTILRMIAGALQLNFDAFRRVPFTEAILTLDGGGELKVRRRDDPKMPLVVEFGGLEAVLTATRSDPTYSVEQDRAREVFRQSALRTFRQVDFEFLSVDRAFAQQIAGAEEARAMELDAHSRTRRTERARHQLAMRVREFIREAQLNHNRYFRTEDSGSLFRTLTQFKAGKSRAHEEIIEAIEKIAGSDKATLKYGLVSGSRELADLRRAAEEERFRDPGSLAIISSHLEPHERAQRERARIVERLSEFESIMDEFLIDKKVRISREGGLRSSRQAESLLTKGS